MKTIETTVYEFSELSDAAKDKARDWYRQGALDYEWWDSIYEDAKTAGLKLTEFDLDRNRHAGGSFIVSAESCAAAILANHGDTCETYKTAIAFLAERKRLAESNADSELIEDCESEFLKSILEDYSIVLQKEYEWLLSDEQMDESITANGYTFTDDGKRFG